MAAGSRLKGWKLGLACFCLGALAAVGQAPLDWWFASLPALGGLYALILAQHARGIWAGTWAAWLGGAGYFCAALSWIISPFLVEADTYAWMAPFALLLMGFGLALFWGLAAYIGLRAARPALGLAVALGAAELARGYVLTGFPWALLGHIWIDTPVAQWAAVVGPSGLALLSTLLAAAIAAGAIWGRVAGGAGLAALWAFGAWGLMQPMPADTAVTVRLVQPNAAQSLKWDEAQARVFYDRLIAATSAQPTPDVVIWPETALPYMQEYNPDLPRLMAQAAGGATLIYGRQRIDGNRGYNSLSVLSPDGVELALYDKHHLVPFGEYIPFGDLAYDWFGLTAFAAQVGNGYTAGTGPTVIDLGPFGKMLPLICYEAVFPQDLRAGTRPDWLLHATNDAWFGTISGPFQHAAQARLRAIEQGLPMLRVANTGVTAVYDARGRLRADLPFGTQGHLDVALPAPISATIYAQAGELPVLVLLALCALLALARPKRRRY
jgi:apolipoprotein N-acyltransferase